MRTEIVDDEQVAVWVSDASRGPAVFLDVDLRPTDETVGRVDLGGCLFAGCVLGPAVLAAAAAAGCTVLPPVAGLPFRPYRGRLYTAPELYEGLDPDSPGSWRLTPDFRAFDWFVDPVSGRPRTRDAGDMVLARSHDSCVERALIRYLAGSGRRVIGVMGGHDVHRGDGLYRSVAEAARELTLRGALVVTGGGPGLMEAANLGAFLSPFPASTMDRALGLLRGADDFRSHDWLRTACRVRELVLGSWRDASDAVGSSIGVPTWFYGHEPPNLFATHVAKLFYNSLREDGLVTVADGGILFATGNAGTVQEVFQDATQNYYRPRTDGAPVPATPMVLLDTAYWDPDSDRAVPGAKPLWPLLRRLAEEGGFGDALLLTDDIDSVVERLMPRGTGGAPAAPLAWRRTAGRSARTASRSLPESPSRASLGG